MYKSILVATFIAAATSAAVAKEVCHDEQVQQITCKTTGDKSCTVTYVTAHRCHQEPDTPAKSAAAGRTNQVLQSDIEISSNNGAQLMSKSVFLTQ